jgi:hypothetical protein
VGAEEFGYVAADPLHLASSRRQAVALRRSTGDVQNVTPDPLRTGEYRWMRTMPVLFCPWIRAFCTPRPTSC